MLGHQCSGRTQTSQQVVLFMTRYFSGQERVFNHMPPRELNEASAVTWLIPHIPQRRSHANARSPAGSLRLTLIMGVGVRGICLNNWVLSFSETNHPGDLFQITNENSIFRSPDYVDIEA